jgi:adenosine deaminase
MLSEALDRLPKVELHVHVEGTMRPQTVMDLAARNGIVLPTDDVTELYRYTSLDTFLEVFWLVQSTLGSREDWARLGYESVIDGAAHGRVHAETFFTPARHLAAGQSLGDVIAGLAEGVAAGDAETGATTWLICDADRAYGGTAARQLVEELGELRGSGAPGTDRVIGFGMDSTELGVDPLDFAPAFTRAKELGLRRTAHQGEDTPASAIAQVVDVLGAERIDHGLSVLGDPALVHRLAQERMPITVCPTSNIVIANRFAVLADHPLPLMRAAGLLATVNTDDPAMTDLDLGKEFAACAEAFGWTWDDAVAVALDGVEACWLDDADKAQLRQRVATEAARLGGEL